METAPDFTFMQRSLDWYVGGMTTLMIDLGHRCGLFDAAGAGPFTSAELAERAGCDERYVREWLSALTVPGVFQYDPATKTFELPAGVAPFVTGDGPFNFAPAAQGLALFARFVQPVARCVREGGGVPYDEYRPEFTGVMDAMGRTRYDASLISEYIPQAAGLADALAAGVSVVDIGCGTGHTTNLMARAYPGSSFVGYDLADDAIARARREAKEWGLENVEFETTDILAVDAPGRFDVVCAFDCIHDQVDPAGVLAWVERSLDRGGQFFMVDVAGSSNLEDNVGNPMAQMGYASSVLHCMTVSLAHDGAGLGTMWGEQLATSMLTDAGLGDVTIHRLATDPFNAIYVAKRPS